MSHPLALPTSGSSCPTSTFLLHTKRPRGSPDEYEFNSSTQGRRKQLKIEIPPTPLYVDSPHSVKESPSSLFSAVSEADQMFDDDADLSISQSQRVPDTGLFATSSPTALDRDLNEAKHVPLALLTAPPIHGLYFDPTLSLPHEIASNVMNFCLKTYFCHPNVNQVMLFGRAPNTKVSDLSLSTNGSRIPNDNASSITGLPTILIDLLSTLSTLLKPFLPEKTYTLLFPPSPTQARQAIINLYNPGEGISPHVDLLKRYGDGIIGVSFGSGSVMRFNRVARTANGSHHVAGRSTVNGDDNEGDSAEGADPEQERDRWDLYLPERSILVLSEDARYGWTHGIDKLTRDYVSVSEPGTGSGGLVNEEDASGRWIERGVRLSVTFRWLLPGADVVGPETT